MIRSQLGKDAGTAAALAALALTLAGSGVEAKTEGLPLHLGDCVNTRVKSVETRLTDGRTKQPIAGSGSAVVFTNGGYQVSYDTVPAIDASHVGDPVRMCLTIIPHHCPPGDNRGRHYRTTNLRTHKTWSLPDNEHGCRGA